MQKLALIAIVLARVLSGQPLFRVELSRVSFSVNLLTFQRLVGFDSTNEVPGTINFTIHLSEKEIAIKSLEFCQEHGIDENACQLEVFENAIKFLYLAQVQQKYEPSISMLDYILQQRIFDSQLKSDTRFTLTLMPDVGDQMPSIETMESMLSHEVRIAKKMNNIIDITNTMKNKIRRICFIHSTTIEFQLFDVLHNILDQIITHGLINNLQHVFVLNYGLEIPLEIQQQYTSPYSHIHFIQVTNDITWAEVPTLRILHQITSQLVTFNPSLQVLYLHTKGVSYILPHRNIYDWINMLLYFTVERHKSCHHMLSSGEFDAIGVNYVSNSEQILSNITSRPAVYTDRFYPSHFAGNFWWATGRYLASIPSVEYSTNRHKNKFDCEFWLLDPYMIKEYTEDNLIHLKAHSYLTHVSPSSPPPPRVYCPHFSTGVNHYYNPYPRSRYVIKQ